MRRAFASLTIAALAAAMSAAVSAQAPANEPPLLRDMRRYCLQADGFEAGLRLAEADGWMVLPDAMTAQRPRMFTSVEGRMRTSREGMSLIMVGRGRVPFGNEMADVDLCFVGSQPADHRAVEAAMQTWMGRRPMRRGDPNIWAWVETPEGRRAIDNNLSNRQAEAALATGGMRMVLSGRNGEMSMVGYAIPRLCGRAT